MPAGGRQNWARSEILLLFADESDQKKTEALVRQARRLILANAAFSQCRELAQRIETAQLFMDDPAFTPMAAGIVVTYAKNFLQADGIGPLPDKYLKFPHPSLDSMHKDIVEMRHQTYAHRDIESASSYTFEADITHKAYDVAITFEEASNQANSVLARPMIP